MLRALGLAAMISLLLASTASAEEHGHEEERHVFAAGGIEIIHPWARAAAAGEETLVFFELHNEGQPDRLAGARTDVAEDVHIVGLTLGAEGGEVQEVGVVDIPAGAFAFDPGGLALELHSLTQTLEQGGHFDLVLQFEGAGAVEIEVAVEAAGATQHSHAGHSH